MTNTIPTPANDESLLPDKQIDVYIINLDIQNEQLPRYEAHLNDEERIYSSQLRIPAYRRHFIAARAQQRYQLARYLTQSPREIVFDYGSQGKPFLAADVLAHTGLQFNVSHSGKKMVMAITTHHAVGIDIEYHNCEIDFETLAERFFTQHEWQMICKKPVSQRCRAFYDYWSHKEAVIKALGGGLSIDLKGFEINLENTPNIIQNTIWETDIKMVVVAPLMVLQHFSGAVAITDTPMLPVKVWSAPNL